MHRLERPLGVRSVAPWRRSPWCSSSSPRRSSASDPGASAWSARREFELNRARRGGDVRAPRRRGVRVSQRRQQTRRPRGDVPRFRVPNTSMSVGPNMALYWPTATAPFLPPPTPPANPQSPPAQPTVRVGSFSNAARPTPSSPRASSPRSRTRIPREFKRARRRSKPLEHHASVLGCPSARRFILLIRRIDGERASRGTYATRIPPIEPTRRCARARRIFRRRRLGREWIS